MQLAGRPGSKIANLVLAAHIDIPRYRINNDGAYYRLVGQRILLPVVAVKTQYPIIIGEIQYAILPLLGRPCLRSPMIILVGVVNDFRQPDGVLTKAPAARQDKPKTGK